MSRKLFNEQDFLFIASRHTGVLTFSIDECTSDTNILPFKNPYTKIAFLSWGYLLRMAACDMLDIETNELDIGYRVSPKGIPEVFLVEKLDNGAGYCNYLNGKTNPKVAKKAFITSLFEGGTVYERLIQKQHEEDCQASCYDCLRDYYNQQYHSFLNWRIGLDLAKLSSSVDATISFDIDYWKELMPTITQRLAIKLGGIETGFAFGVHFIKTTTKNIVITHPLWDDLKIQSIKNKFDGIVECHLSLIHI